MLMPFLHSKHQNRSKKAHIFSLVLLICFIANMMMPFSPVLSAEEEEEDDFTVPPNFRYENQSTTTNSQEDLIGDLYDIYTSQNATTGNAKFEKSRLLNTRDFYVDTKFQIDNGGNETEWFRDVKGNVCNFDDGSKEDWLNYGGISSSTVNEGYLILDLPGDWDGIDYRANYNFNLAVWEGIRLKIKASVENFVLDFRMFEFYGSNSYMTYDATIGTTWEELDIPFANFSLYRQFKSYDSFKRIIINSDGSNSAYPVILYLDYIEIYGKYDYATAIEGEVEDTWDWDNFQEYFYHEEENISDFGDGTTEDWSGYLGSTVAQEKGWIHLTEQGDEGGIQRSGLSIAATTYHYLTFEFNATENIDQIKVYDSGDNICEINNTGWAKDTYHLFNADISNVNWTGTETALKIGFKADTSDFQVFLNFTFLYNLDRGDKEVASMGTTWDYSFVHPYGYLVMDPSETSSWGGTVNLKYAQIDASVFTTLEYRARATENLGIRFKQGADYLGAANYITSSWAIYTLDLTQFSEWDSEQANLAFVIYEEDGQGNFDGDEWFELDYLLLRGNYTGSFKFSLLNEEKQEGMYFKFTNQEYNNTYLLEIDMLDITGVALEYNKLFEYNHANDGWIHLDLDWHLDKRELDFKLYYENGSTILKTREFSDIYPQTGVSNLILLKPGMPSLCINNSQIAHGRSWVIIDYIDADWDIINWIEPPTDEEWTHGDGQTPNQDGRGNWSSISPHGCNLYQKSIDDKVHHYFLDISRFDGINFQVGIQGTGWDYSAPNTDRAFFFFQLFNVRTDGSLKAIFYINYLLDYFGSSWDAKAWLFDESGGFESTIDASGLTIGELAGQVNVYRESDNQIVVQYSLDAGNTQASREYTEDAVLDQTSEYVALFWFECRTSVGGAADDHMDIIISNFDVTRKDWLGDIVGNILGGIIGIFVGIISFIFKPIIWGLQQVAKFIGDALGVLGDILSPILEGIIDAIGGIVDFFIAGLEDIMDALLPILFELAEDIADFLFDVLKFIVDLLGTIATELINLGATILFAFWDDFLGGPDLLAILDAVLTDFLIPVIAGIPGFIVDLVGWIYLGGQIGLLIYWIWALFLGFASEGFEPLEGLSEFISRMFMGPDVTFMGFGPVRVCMGWFVFLPLTLFIIVSPTGASWFIW